MEWMVMVMVLMLIWLRFSSPSSTAAGDDDFDGIEANISPRREKYDVFVSFRGEDTRRGITSHLHAALLQKKIETYIDYRLQKGKKIRPALRTAIEKSTHSVIIFSKNYASSTWCLDELVHILECVERYGQKVIPVFYDINPSDVRNQHGSYAAAFAQLEKDFKDSIDKVHKWRRALKTAADLSGFDYSNKQGTEADLIKNVVDHIWTSLNCESSCDLEGLVGIESRIQQIESRLGIDSKDACITVGIWGDGSDHRGPNQLVGNMHRRDPRSLIGCAPKQWPLSDCDSRKIRPWNQLRAPHAQAAVRVRSAGKNQKTMISEDQYFDALENNDVQRGFGNPSSPFGGKSEGDGDTERWS